MEIMRKIKNIQDIVDWGLCVGCGACYAVCGRPEAVNLINIESVGIRPRFDSKVCNGCVECLAVCPGYRIDAQNVVSNGNRPRVANLLIGPTYKVWEGHARDPEVRFNASSGGILTALALYALEKEKMAFVVHTGMDPERPWCNKTKQSRSRQDLLHNAGSRYATSSPCELLRTIEESDRPCVFIGKPCDVAAVNMARKIRPRLDANLGLVLSFFCAGTPSTKATLDLLKELNVEAEQVNALRYRGEGWPGHFRVDFSTHHQEKKIAYIDSWSKLARQRPFRCHLCPDGLGELSDITAGDAWNKYEGNGGNPGLSHVLARTARGYDTVQKAIAAGYLTLQTISPNQVIEAQGLVQRRREVFGRCLAMRLIGIPVTSLKNFGLLRAWLQNGNIIKLRTVIGTFKRILQRRLWRRNPLFK